MAPREGSSSRPALFLQVCVHQLPVNDPVHVILQRGRRGGVSSCSYLVLGLDREVTDVTGEMRDEMKEHCSLLRKW